MCSVGVELRLVGVGRTCETKTEQTLCVRAYAKAKGSEAAGLFLCPTLGFLSHKAAHTVSHTTKTGTLGPGLCWLLGTAVSINFTYGALQGLRLSIQRTAY